MVNYKQQKDVYKEAGSLDVLKPASEEMEVNDVSAR